MISTPNRRVCYLTLASLLLISGCTTGLPATPAQVTPPAGIPSAMPTPVQPTEPALPVSPVVASLTGLVVFPTGVFPKLKASLRAQGAVPPADLTAEELAGLVVTYNGVPLSPEQYRFSDLQWDRHAQLITKLQLLDVTMVTGGSIAVASRSGSVYLESEVVTAGTSHEVRIDVRSTATTLLARSLPGQAVPAALAALVEKRLTDLLASSGATAVKPDSSLASLLQRIGAAIASGEPIDAAALARIATPPATSGGGGQTVSTLTLTSTSLAGDKWRDLIRYNHCLPGQSPQLTWTGAPASVQSYVVVMTNTSAPWYHWVIYDVPATTTSLNLAEGITAPGVVGSADYAPGDAPGPQAFVGLKLQGTSPDPQTFSVTVYGIDAPTLGSATVLSADEVLNRIVGHVVIQGTLTGTWSPSFNIAC